MQVGGVGEAGTVRPEPVRIPQGEQPRCPALRGDPGTLGRDLVGRGVGQVAHDLVADRGIGVQEPGKHVHAGRLGGSARVGHRNGILGP